MERGALGVVREDDLPGSQAPAAWLQYLRGGSSSQLKRVAAHNHQDVVTLAALMAELVALHAADAEHARSRFAQGGAGTPAAHAGRHATDHATDQPPPSPTPPRAPIDRSTSRDRVYQFCTITGLR